MQIITDYRDQSLYRELFFEFIENVFPNCDFRSWYDKGFWNETYIPYSIVTENRISANVSIQIMNLIINGKPEKGLQFSAVGTLKNQRKKGLSKYLMEHVLGIYCKQFKYVFLFANESVLNFYPRFGFNRVHQFIYRKSKTGNKHFSGQLRKLNIGSKTDYRFLLQSLNNRIPVTKNFGSIDYTGISMWHIFNFYRENIFFITDLNAVVIAIKEEGTLKIVEVISDQITNLDDIDSYFGEEVNDIVFYFPPDQFSFGYDRKEYFKDSPLFILGSVNFESENIKFPETAMT